MDLAHLFTGENLIALLTLTGLEIVLGIDNIIFIAILCGRLPPAQRDKARIFGLALAMLSRIALLFSIRWVMSLDKHELLSALGHAFTGKDLVLVIGGLFLVGKSTLEIHHKIETGGAVEAVPHEKPDKPGNARKKGMGFASALVQILLLDLVFSLDSVITAVGMVDANKPGGLTIMIVAVVAAVGVMLLASGFIARFVDRHPTIKMLALSFLILIGVMLLAEGFGQHVNKNYIYFAMAFSLAVELLNMWVKKTAAKSQPTA
jgi:predicted tellurium resistance membrane protein TerC